MFFRSKDKSIFKDTLFKIRANLKNNDDMATLNIMLISFIAMQGWNEEVAL